MSKALFSWGAPKALLLAAAASAAMIVGGCSQEQQPGGGMASAPPTGAVQASDTGRAQSPSESRVSMSFPTGNRNSSDLMVEQIGAREVRVGQPYTYQIRVTNLTDQPLTGVIVRERIPDNFKLTSEAARDNDQDHRARFDVGELGPKQSKTIEVTGTASEAGTLDTCLSAQYNPPMLCSHVAVVAPAIKAIVEGPSQVDVCQDLTYHYTITNTGSGTAHNVVLQETLPDGLATTDGQKSFSVNVGDLAQGQSKDVNARLRAAEAGRYTTYAVVHSDAGDAKTQEVATQVLAPRLAVTISGPKEAYLGQAVAYQVTVTNRGDAPAMATRVRLGSTPGHVQFVSAMGADGASLASDREGGGESLGTLAPKESRSLTVNFNTLQNGAIAVDATAAAKCAHDVTTFANTNIAAVTASALIVTHDPDPVMVGGNVTYKLIVENKGSVADHNIRLTATLPESEQYVSATGQTNATGEGRELTFAPIATLEPKQRVMWTVTAKALRADATAAVHVTLVSEATPKAAVKIEPTKLIGIDSGVETRTREAPATPSNDHPAPPQGELNK
jgi:uncharacterized repeat protein (TIGR01451 family)